MNPTRAPGMSERTPSSIPTPARRIGQTATFLPEIRWTVIRSSGVSISTSSVASSFVASYVRSRVSSFTSWRNDWVGVDASRRRPSLCWTSGWVTSTTGAAVRVAIPSGLVGRVPAPARVERAAFAEGVAPAPERVEVGLVGEGVGDHGADLAHVLLVEPPHRDGGSAEAQPRGDGGRALVEGDRVPVRRDPHLVQPLLGVAPRPVRPAEIDLDQVRVGPAGQEVEAAVQERVGERVGVRAHLALVGAEALGGGDQEARRLRRDRVDERPALHPGEERLVDRLGVLLLAEDEAGP